MASTSSFKNLVKPLTWQYEWTDPDTGETVADPDLIVKLKYRPLVLTRAMIREIQARIEAGEGLIEQTIAVIAEWDLLDDATGKPVPFTPEALDGVSIVALSGMLLAASNASIPQRPSSNGS